MKKCEFSDFDHGMVVDVRCAGLNVSEGCEIKNDVKKHPVSSSSAGNILLMREIFF